MELKNAMAGTLESGDILIQIAPSDVDGLHIELDSTVAYQFGEQIKKVIINTLTDLGITKANVKATDKGALDSKSTWMPVVKGWTSTRDFDGLSKTRFRTWFKNHTPLQAEVPVQEFKGTEGGGE